MLANSFDEYRVLENVNQWIFNCDTKASILLATYGVASTIVSSSEIEKAIVNIIRANVAMKNTCSFIYMLMLIVAIILFVFGLYKLFSALSPRIHSAPDSVMFFGKVAKYNNFDSYFQAVGNRDKAQIKKDLLEQIFEASRICNEKFKCYKCGLRFSLIGLLIFILWLVIGFLKYYI